MSESMKLNLTLPVPVSINKLYISQYSWNPKTRTQSPTGKRIMGREGKKVKKQIQEEAIKQMKLQSWDYEYTKENHIYMDTYIWFPRRGRDDNNVYKLLADSLEKIAYENDSRVLIRTQRILYDTQNPRINVSLYPVEYIGIFDNQNKLNKFESKCQTCKRYKRNCSILRKAKEGIIQDEINEDFVCNKYSEVK